MRFQPKAVHFINKNIDMHTLCRCIDLKYALIVPSLLDVCLYGEEQVSPREALRSLCHQARHAV